MKVFRHGVPSSVNTLSVLFGNRLYASVTDVARFPKAFLARSARYLQIVTTGLFQTSRKPLFQGIS